MSDGQEPKHGTWTKASADHPPKGLCRVKWSDGDETDHLEFSPTYWAGACTTKIGARVVWVRLYEVAEPAPVEVADV